MFIKFGEDYAGQKAGALLEVDDAIGRAYIAAGKASEHTAAAEDSLIASALSELTKANEERWAAVNKQISEGLRSMAAGTRPDIRIDAGESEADRTRGFNDFVRNVAAFQQRNDATALERLVKVYGARFTDAEGREVRGLEGAQGSTGGVLVPPEYATELLKIPAEMAVVADAVRTVPMSSPQKFYPTLRQTGTNPAAAGESQIYAGIRTYYKSEKAQRTESTPAFDFIELNAVDLIAYTEATRDLMADAPGVQSDVFDLFRTALGWKMDYAFLRADGVGKPLGMLSTANPALISVTRSSTGEIVYDDCLNMLASLMAVAWSSARWIANVTTVPKLCTIKDDAGNSMWQPSAREGLPNTLMGIPVRFTEKVPVLGSASDLSLVAPPFYLHGLRAGVEIAVSEDFRFDTDEVAFRAKLRHDGQPWMKGTYRQADGSNTAVSPFATLAA